MSLIDQLEIPPTPLLAGVDRSEWPQILASTRRYELDSYQPVFLEGDPADDFVVLIKGSVQVSVHSGSGPMPLVELGPGAMLGEIGFLLGGTRTATVRTLEPSTFLRFANSDFEQILGQHTPAAFQMLKNIALSVANRLRTADSQLEEMGRQAATPPVKSDLLRVRKSLLD